jgi:hypothetical protein
MSCRERRPRVYIAGPITKGDMLSNIRQAESAFLTLARAGFAPLCPHWSVFCGSSVREVVDQWERSSGLVEVDRVRATANALPSGTTHADWMGIDLAWVAMADAVLRLPGESVGADAEVSHAFAHSVPVFHCVADLIATFSPRA